MKTYIRHCAHVILYIPHPSYICVAILLPVIFGDFQIFGDRIQLIFRLRQIKCG